MGIFLATPCTDVESETGEGAGLRYAVGEMQGWRKNMEDAHIASTNIPIPTESPTSSISLFGVFDGHGGKEVSAFVKLKYIEVLTSLPSFREGRYEDALRESFHKIDELLEEDEYALLLKQLRAVPNPSDRRHRPFTSTDTTSLTANSLRDARLQAMEARRQQQQSGLLSKGPAGSESVAGSIIRPITLPVRSSSPDSDDGSDSPPPVIDRNRDASRIILELLAGAKQYKKAKLRNLSSSSSSDGATTDSLTSRPSNGHLPQRSGTTPSSFIEDDDSVDSRDSSESSSSDDDRDSERDSEDSSADEELQRMVQSPPIKKPVEVTFNAEADSAADADTAASSTATSTPSTSTVPATTVEPSPPKSPARVANNPYKGETYHAVFSEHIEEQAEGAVIAEAETETEAEADLVVKTEETSVSSLVSDPERVEPLLSWLSTDRERGEGETATLSLEESGEEESDIERMDKGELSPVIVHHQANVRPPIPPTLEEEKGSSEDSAVEQRVVKTFNTVGNVNVCALKDHRVLAGCTAIVALKVNNSLIVANAGDSRGVLSRNGVAVALSEDHKPSQEREITRITAAGGFVNMVGRVNGNLNLSRSLGDLKYKQSKHLPPEAQMITAEPDIRVFPLTDEDEFFILACDGIWDVLTNQAAVDLVRETVYQQHRSLHEVIQVVMKRCLATDVRTSQGIGGDNMTFLVVWLQDSTAPPVRTPEAEREEASSTRGTDATDEVGSISNDAEVKEEQDEDGGPARESEPVGEGLDLDNLSL